MVSSKKVPQVHNLMQIVHSFIRIKDVYKYKIYTNVYKSLLETISSLNTERRAFLNILFNYHKTRAL